MITNPALRRLLALVALGAVTGGCLEAASGPLAPPAAGSPPRVLVPALEAADAVVSAIIGSAGGTLHIRGGHSLHFPPGALPGTTLVRAVPLGGGARIEVGPHGLVFPDSAQPTLTFSYAAGADPERMSIVYLDSSGVVREVLPTEVDPVARTARARLRHFSTYALVTD